MTQFPVSNIIADVIEITGFNYDQITGFARLPYLVRVRDAIAWVAREAHGRTWNEIGEVIGGRDHKTIFSAHARAATRRATEHDFLVLTDKLLSAAKERASAAFERNFS
jgi:chromosomal replication initiation ATPase DnaA